MHVPVFDQILLQLFDPLALLEAGLSVSSFSFPYVKDAHFAYMENSQVTE